MKFNLELIIALDALNKYKTFSLAAKSLNKTSSALIYQVQKAESIMGIRILDRGNYRTAFTTEGKMLLEEGLVILNAAKKIESKYLNIKERFSTMKISIAYNFPLYIANAFLDNTEFHKCKMQVFFHDILMHDSEYNADIYFDIKAPHHEDYTFLNLKENIQLFIQPEQQPYTAPLIYLNNEHDVFDDYYRTKVLAQTLSDKIRLLQLTKGCGLIPVELSNYILKDFRFSPRYSMRNDSYKVIYRKTLDHKVINWINMNVEKIRSSPNIVT